MASTNLNPIGSTPVTIYESMSDEASLEISILPPELLLSIFHYLPFSALSAASLTCKEWRALANYHYLRERNVAEDKLGQSVVYYFTPYVQNDEVTWQEVAKWATPSFLRFLDKIRSFFKRQGLEVDETMGMLEIMKKEMKEEESEMSGIFYCQEVDPWLVAGAWTFAIEPDYQTIKIQNTETGLQHVFRATPDVTFTHLAHEGSFLFALTWDGRIYQIDYQKCYVPQIIETSLSLDPNGFIKEHLGGHLAKYETAVLPEDGAFSVQEGKIILFYKETLVDVIHFQKPENERIQTFTNTIHEESMMTSFVYDNRVFILKEFSPDTVEILQHDLTTGISHFYFFPSVLDGVQTAVELDGNQFYGASRDGCFFSARIGNDGTVGQIEEISFFDWTIPAIGLIKDYYLLFDSRSDSVNFVHRESFNVRSIFGNIEDVVHKTLQAFILLNKSDEMNKFHYLIYTGE